MYDGSDLIGKRFGKLVVISVVPKEERKDKKRMYYNVICDCGTRKVVRRDSLTSGAVISCGCTQKERARELRLKHDYYNERLYKVWAGMKQRCSNPNNKEYSKYGGKGISVCSEWANSYPVFREFMLSHGYDPNAPFGKCTIDRINNDGDYEPNNCRIITIQEQQHNRETSAFYYLNGEKLTLAQVAEKTGIKRVTLQCRLDKGMSIEDAIRTPLRTLLFEANNEIHTISEWATILNVPRSTIQGRLQNHSMQDIYDDWKKNNGKLIIGDFSSKYHTVNGVTKKQIEWAKELNIPPSTLRYKLKKHTMQEIYDSYKNRLIQE